MADTQPNVLLIHCHDIGQHLGCYGVDIETPNLDSLAEEGALLENHYVSAPQCSPSRGSLMTGQMPHVNGLMGLAHGEWEIESGRRVMPQYFNEEGYETHLFGLQHIAQDTDRLEYEYVHSEGNLYPGVSPEVHQVNRARTVASVVSTFLEKELYEKPFFASIGFFEAHRAEEENGRFGFESDFYGCDDPEEVQPLPYLPDRQGIRRDLAAMRRMLYAIDDAVGTILEGLEENGIAEETVVIFTTEHGIAFPRAKGSCYDPGIEAAFLVRYPGVVEPDERYDELISNVDVLPTLLELIGSDIPDDLGGRSFRSLVTGGETDDEDEAQAGNDDYEERERLFAEITWHDMYNPVRAIRTQRYKYIRNFWHLPTVYLTADIFSSLAGREVREEYATPLRAYEELYDLDNDPQEGKNLIYEPQYEDVRLRLASRLREWMEETDDPLLDGPVAPEDYDEMVSWPEKDESD
ncbi:sulfatase family protein [Halostagnicola bangensis]